MKRILQIVVGILLIGGAAFARQPAPGKKLTEQQIQALAFLEPMFLYHPRKYATNVIESFSQRGGERLDYTTAQGKQSAWLIAPAGGAEKLWVMCGGNATLALELESLSRAFPFKQDAWLLVDYPGYGECEGQPRRHPRQSQGVNPGGGGKTQAGHQRLAGKSLCVRPFAGLRRGAAGGAGVSPAFGGALRAVYEHARNGAIAL